MGYLNVRLKNRGVMFIFSVANINSVLLRREKSFFTVNPRFLSIVYDILYILLILKPENFMILICIDTIIVKIMLQQAHCPKPPILIKFRCKKNTKLYAYQITEKMIFELKTYVYRKLYKIPSKLIIISVKNIQIPHLVSIYLRQEVS